MEKHKQKLNVRHHIKTKWHLGVICILLLITVLVALIINEDPYCLTLVSDGQHLDITPRTDVAHKVPRYAIGDTAVIVYTFYKRKTSLAHQKEWRLALTDEQYQLPFTDGVVAKDNEEVTVKLYKALVISVPEK